MAMTRLFEVTNGHLTTRIELGVFGEGVGLKYVQCTLHLFSNVRHVSKVLRTVSKRDCKGVLI